MVEIAFAAGCRVMKKKTFGYSTNNHLQKEPLQLETALQSCFSPWVVYSILKKYLYCSGCMLTMSIFTFRAVPATIARIIKSAVFFLKR